MHKYKVRMGFEAMPLHRMFAPCWSLRPLLKSSVASRVWEYLADRFPQYSALRKAAGLSRLMSGRETAPLAWAEEADR